MEKVQVQQPNHSQRDLPVWENRRKAALKTAEPGADVFLEIHQKNKKEKKDNDGNVVLPLVLFNLRCFVFTVPGIFLVGAHHIRILIKPPFIFLISSKRAIFFF